MVRMNKLPIERRCQVISTLVEGCSIRSTVRMTRVAKNTVTNLLVDVGTAYAEYQHNAMRNLSWQRLQLGEIWSSCREEKGGRESIDVRQSTPDPPFLLCKKTRSHQAASAAKTGCASRYAGTPRKRSLRQPASS